MFQVSVFEMWWALPGGSVGPFGTPSENCISMLWPMKKMKRSGAYLHGWGKQMCCWEVVLTDSKCHVSSLYLPVRPELRYCGLQMGLAQRECELITFFKFLQAHNDKRKVKKTKIAPQHWYQKFRILSIYFCEDGLNLHLAQETLSDIPGFFTIKVLFFFINTKNLFPWFLSKNYFDFLQINKIK